MDQKARVMKFYKKKRMNITVNNTPGHSQIVRAFIHSISNVEAQPLRMRERCLVMPPLMEPSVANLQPSVLFWFDTNPVLNPIPLYHHATPLYTMSTIPTIKCANKC